MATVLLQPGDGRLRLIFQGNLRCDKRRLAVERIFLGLKSLQLGGRAA
ncbi:MAG: hypothetical protein R3F14_35415 [Polyangiaceae bacterium]